MEHKPRKWNIRSARNIYENPWLQLREYDAIAPTEVSATYGLVHFKNLAIGILPIDADGQTILVGQERFVFGTYSWELPEGGGSLNELPLNSAKRELAEEVGLQAKRWDVLLEGVQMSNSVTDERAFAYIASDLSVDNTHEKDAWEDLSIRRVPFRRAVEMAVNGQILDMFSLAMLLKASHLANEGALSADLNRLLKG